jgi:spore maturation protein CgeB
MSAPLAIAFSGSSLVSSHWNGAATYYRDLVRSLAEHTGAHRAEALDRSVREITQAPSIEEVSASALEIIDP